MNIVDLKSKLTKNLDFLKNEMSQIRTGRASPTLVENIAVDAYGSRMTVKELGSITLLDNQNLLISPWDKGLLTAVARAIRESGMGLNPVDDNEKIRVPVPALTEERRKEFSKMVATKVEECKITLRIVRQEIMKDIDRSFTDKEIGEDEKFKQKEDVEKIVKEFVDEADSLGEKKKLEIMTI